MVFTWGGTATDVSVSGLPSAGISFVKNTTNKTVTISGTPTANVNFTITTIGTSGTSVSGTGSITVTTTGTNPQGNEVHNFTTSALSSSFYTFTSANMNSTEGSASYDGLSLTKRLKIESSTTISYSTSAASSLTLVFDPTFSGTVKVDGTSYTASSGIVSIPSIAAGSHSITKGSVANLYYIKTQYQSALTSRLSQEEVAEPKAVIYPNPVQNVFSLSTDSEIESITITNSTGRVMKEIRGNVQKVDISNFESGVYLVLIKTNKGLLQQKVIKK